MSRLNISFMILAVLTVQGFAVASESVSSGQVQPQGQATKRAPAAAKTDSTEDDEYNFSWLDPDKKVYVLQNRKFRKAGHAAIYLQGGLNLDNPYRSEALFGPRVAYWLTEQFGFEAFYYNITSTKNETFSTLEDAASNSGALPFVRQHKSYLGALFTWTPWYAKLNFFNKIIYFDWFFNIGAGQASTSVDRNRLKTELSQFESENPFTLFYGTGQNFFISEHFSVRLDVIGSSYSATSINRNTTKRYWNWDFVGGIGYLF